MLDSIQHLNVFSLSHMQIGKRTCVYIAQICWTVSDTICYVLPFAGQCPTLFVTYYHLLDSVRHLAACCILPVVD